MPGVLVGVKLVGLAEFLEGLFGLGRISRRGARVLDAEQAEQRTLQVLGEIDRGYRLPRRQLFGLGDDAAAVAGDHGIDPAQRARGKVRLAPAGAEADDADPAVEIGQRAQVVDGALHVAHRAIVRHAAGRADTGAVLFRRRLALPELQVGHDRYIAVMGEAAPDFL